VIGDTLLSFVYLYHNGDTALKNILKEDTVYGVSQQSELIMCPYVMSENNYHGSRNLSGTWGAADSK
jgi:hypothetical protein